MTDLTSLIEKLEKATSPDRHLDARICWTLGLEPWAGTDEIHLTHFGIGSRIDKRTPAYTASIDAAVSLAERVLPGWCFDEIRQDWEGSPTGVTGFGWTVEMVNGLTRVQGQAKTFPIAILLATLRALQQKGSSNG